jgi:PleD family two-component response regulator
VKEAPAIGDIGGQAENACLVALDPAASRAVQGDAIQYLRVLVVEDDPGDWERTRRLLLEIGVGESGLMREETLAAGVERLSHEEISLVLLDLDLPDRSEMEALRTMLDAAPSTPVIVLTGCDERQFGLKAVSMGAQDYLIKEMVNASAMRRCLRYSLERFRLLEEREELVEELRKALQNVKTLRGILPICSKCKKIRDDDGYWQRVERYVSAHTEADFSHGLCPDCLGDYTREIREILPGFGNGEHLESSGMSRPSSAS